MEMLPVISISDKVLQSELSDPPQHACLLGCIPLTGWHTDAIVLFLIDDHSSPGTIFHQGIAAGSCFAIAHEPYQSIPGVNW